MLQLLRIVCKARRPSTLRDMPAIAAPFLIRKGYMALTFFGMILTHTREEAAKFNEASDALKHHEMIHLRQAVSTGDSWWRFYVLYLKFWWQARRVRRRYPNAGYRLNPFEMEAYDKMYDPTYLDRCKDGATGWQRFARMTLEERIRYLNTDNTTPTPHRT